MIQIQFFYVQLLSISTHLTNVLYIFVDRQTIRNDSCQLCAFTECSMFVDFVLAPRILSVCDRLVTGKHDQWKSSQEVWWILPHTCQWRFSRVPQAEKFENIEGISDATAVWRNHTDFLDPSRSTMATNEHTNEQTNQQTNKHDRSQYLSVKVIY